MKEYFKNKYRTSTNRLQDWDYSASAFYYVTICTKDRVCCLAEIKNKQIYLSKIGKVVFNCWNNIPEHCKNVKLDDWIIMPNHLHGIIIIGNDKDFGINRRDRVYPVSTDDKFGHVKPKSLSSIINTFKGAVTRQCNRENLDFQWQSNYYEHIIRNEKDLARIKKYIANNPINWQFDRNNPINIKLNNHVRKIQITTR